MKTNRFVLLCSVILFAVISSCGDDTTTPTNPVTPVGTVFYSLDSLGVVVNSPNSSNLQTISFAQTIQASKVKVEYRLISNGDTSKCFARYKDSVNASPQRPGEQLVLSPVDTSISYTLDISSQPFYIGFTVRLLTLPQAAMPYYIYFKNIKVTKVE